jgi:hypothetical protein
MFALICANGMQGPPFLIIAVDDMEPDQHYLQKVNGLTFSGDVNAKDGYIAFSKTKDGTHALWKEFFLLYAIPIIELVTDKYNTIDPETGYPEAVLRIDGELTILERLLDSDVMLELKRAKINIIKLAPRATKIQQECDLGGVFKNTKQNLVTIVNFLS